ncbi:Ig-like domain-containing protein [Methanobacterium lacus]|uniref:Ig-like domain-containing protein n=1 Tax=Methanobacterium lacus (strain AL-21) TaxID=877455 RepID=UPI0009FF5BA0|nr:Ig-like domain-containing protein [Methanobacterium lacus]
MIDLSGNKSLIYTQNYIIDKTVPVVTKSTPKNNSNGVSLYSAISIIFSESINLGTNYSKIYIKNLSTGKLVSITKTLNKNTLTIKMSSKMSSLNNYQVYIPLGSVKDLTGKTTQNIQ